MNDRLAWGWHWLARGWFFIILTQDLTRLQAKQVGYKQILSLPRLSMTGKINTIPSAGLGSSLPHTHTYSPRQQQPVTAVERKKAFFPLTLLRDPIRQQHPGAAGHKWDECVCVCVCVFI